MERTVVYLVGDKFQQFSVVNPGVVTLSDFERTIETNDLSSDLFVVVGQGLDQERLASLARRVRENKLEGRVTLWSGGLDRIERGRVHKQCPENVMISEPRRISDKEYELSMLVDERCAEMSDHVTGQHVQGMVLLEAARQAFLGVTESFFMREERRGQYYFVIQDFRMRYENFAFPLPTSIRYRVDRSEIDKRGNMTFVAHMTFRQGDLIVSESTVSFIAYVWKFVERIEAQKARQALASTQKELANGSLTGEILKKTNSGIGNVDGVQGPSAADLAVAP